jgi:putative Mg2+ transporter-C (MgtC) family protein
MDLVIVAQIAVAAALGAAVGVERELDAQAAGLRTHMLVSLGATVFTIAGVTATHGGDPTRVAAQVVTGIGFLGGGAIFREGVNIRGLTTAGSLWVTAAIGISVGVRAWAAAMAATGLALLVLWLVKLVERHLIPGRDILLVTIVLSPDAALDQVERQAMTQLRRPRVVSVDYAANEQKLIFEAHAPIGESLGAIAEGLRLLRGVAGVAVSR